MNPQLQPVNSANLRGLSIAAAVYCLLFAYNLFYFLHIEPFVGNKLLENYQIIGFACLRYYFLCL